MGSSLSCGFDTNDPYHIEPTTIYEAKSNLGSAENINNHSLLSNLGASMMKD